MELAEQGAGAEDNGITGKGIMPAGGASDVHPRQGVRTSWPKLSKTRYRLTFAGAELLQCDDGRDDENNLSKEMFCKQVERQLLCQCHH